MPSTIENYKATMQKSLIVFLTLTDPFKQERFKHYFSWLSLNKLYPTKFNQQVTYLGTVLRDVVVIHQSANIVSHNSWKFTSFIQSCKTSNKFSALEQLWS